MPCGHERMVFMKKSFNVRVLVTCAVMSAIGVVLAFFIHFPIIPAVPFLEYDPADILIFVSTYAFGIPVGLAMTVVVAVVQGITVSAGSGFTGILMHIISTGGYVLAAGLIYKLTEAFKRGKAHKTGAEAARLVLSTVAGIGVTVGLMTLWNIWLTPIFMGIDRKLLIENYLILIVIFNLIKISINGVTSAVLAIPFRKLAELFPGEKKLIDRASGKERKDVDTVLGLMILLAVLLIVGIIVFAVFRT